MSLMATETVALQSGDVFKNEGSPFLLVARKARVGLIAAAGWITGPAVRVVAGGTGHGAMSLFVTKRLTQLGLLIEMTGHTQIIGFFQQGIDRCSLVFLMGIVTVRTPDPVEMVDVFSPIMVLVTAQTGRVALNAVRCFDVIGIRILEMFLILAMTIGTSHLERLPVRGSQDKLQLVVMAFHTTVSIFHDLIATGKK